jgi:hypothetical protein
MQKQKVLNNKNNKSIMKNKFLLAAMVTIIATSAQAQQNSTTTHRTSFGISGGINWNNINGKSASSDKLDNKMVTGFHAGMNVAIPIASDFYLQPGVEYRQKGAELNNGNKLTLGYIDVPVNLMYKPMLGTGRLLLGFGPYAGFGISGNVQSEDGTERKVNFNNTYSTSEAADLQFRKLDAGANFMAGYEFRNKLSFALETQLGLMNINPDLGISTEKTSYKNTGFGLSLGYRL